MSLHVTSRLLLLLLLLLLLCVLLLPCFALLCFAFSADVNLNEQELDELKSNINQQLQLADFELVRGQYEITSEEYIAMCNKTSDDIAKAKFASGFSEQKTQFFKRIIHAIVDQGGQMSKDDAVKLGKHSQSTASIPTVREANDTIEDLVAKGWLFNRHIPGHVPALALGPRAYLDLYSYLMKRSAPANDSKSSDDSSSDDDQVTELECVFCNEICIFVSREIVVVVVVGTNRIALLDQ
jgi:Nse1 non-SMC component of SMC5-6 complex